MPRQTRTWQDNAAEFALLDKGEGWPFARLIACSVRKGSGQGARQPRNDRYEVKVSAQEFARQADTSAPRVLRYLDAWDKASDQGLCTPSADLSPADAPTVMEPDIPWGRVYDASKSGGRPRDGKAEDAAEIIDRRGAAEVVKSLSAEAKAKLAAELVIDEPTLHRAVESMTPAQRRGVIREATRQEIARADEERSHEQDVTMPPELDGIQESLDDWRQARGHITQKLFEAHRLIAGVVHDWPDYEGKFNPDIAIRTIVDIRTELDVLAMHAGVADGDPNVWPGMPEPGAE